MRARRTAGRVATMLGGVATVLAAAVPADAVITRYHGADMGQASHHCIRADDGERDGHGVYTDAYFVGGTHLSVWDGNGADWRWGRWACYGAKRIYKFRVCEDCVGCSTWYYRPS